MATVSVRYIVNDVDAAIAFYCDLLGFEAVMHPAPTFAMLARGDLRLVLSAPGGGPGGPAGQPFSGNPVVHCQLPREASLMAKVNYPTSR